MGYFQGLKQLIGTICGSAAGAAVTGVELANKLGGKATEILFYTCSGGFLLLGLVTRRRSNQPPVELPPPPPAAQQQHKALDKKNVRRERGGNHRMRRPGANADRPAQPGFVFFVTSRGRQVRIISPQDVNDV